MRTIIAFLGFVILFMIAGNLKENQWTQARTVDALIVEKWEDWSGGNDESGPAFPYKVLFAVTVVEKGVKNVYYEKGKLQAYEWNKVVPGETTRTYTTNYKDLGVQPTQSEKDRAWWSGFMIFAIFFLWPMVCLFMLMHYHESRW